MSVTKTPGATTPLRVQQVRQAEELLFNGHPSGSFAKELFHGRFAGNLVFPYPRLEGEQCESCETVLVELRAFCDQHLDPELIDRTKDIPREVIEGLGRIGVLGMTAPSSLGGKGFSQLAYCRLLEELGSRCNATSIFVNAHHSIGMRALLLFGTSQQQRRWLPDLVSGRKLAAFALTEPLAGSDAANVRTLATPTDDGSHYILNGEKRYITNGAIAEFLTVMARVPVPGNDEGAITAFLVTPDMPGFRVVEPRMEKLGVRGSATAKLTFDNMSVPAANILGPPGKGLRVALTVLDFGRTTFGACCTGAAKTCLRLASAHAASRVQFGQPLAEFELVQKKLGRMAAWTCAMEAMTSVTAGLIDRGCDDYMLETAMLKVYTSEALWIIVNDAFQIYGGAAYFTDQPLERMLRDARINQIGEGANEVLTSFIGLVGMRAPAEKLQVVADSFGRPWSAATSVGKLVAGEMLRRCKRPQIPVHSANLLPAAKTLSHLVRQFGTEVQRQLVKHREQILDLQLVQERIAVAAMELYASSCVLSRLESEVTSGEMDASEIQASGLFLKQSARRIRRSLQDIHDNEDALVRATARLVARPPN